MSEMEQTSLISDVKVSDVAVVIKEQKKEAKVKGLVDVVLVSSDKETKLSNDVSVHEIKTDYGPLQVTVSGDLTKPVLLTYHDIGLNHVTCFQPFFNCLDGKKTVFDHFCVVHIDAPGQSYDSSAMDEKLEYLNMQELSEQIVTVMERLKFDSFIGFGVGAGAYILLNFAVDHSESVEGLILLGASSRKCGWIEWAEKWAGYFANWWSPDNLYWKDFFLKRWFGLHSQLNNQDLIKFYSQEVFRIPETNLTKFVQGFQRRKDISDQIKDISGNVFLIVGDNTPLENESTHILGNLNSKKSEWLKVVNCGALITVENPHALVEPISLFLNGLGYYIGRAPPS